MFIGKEFSQNIKLLINPKTNFIKNYSIYSIEYQYRYTEPDYDWFNQFPDNIYEV